MKSIGKLPLGRIGEAQERIAKYYNGEKTDRIPFAFTVQSNVNNCWMAGCPYDFDKMLADKETFLEGNLAAIAWQHESFPDCDAVPVFKTHIFGEGFIPSMFGARQLVVKGAPPFIEGRVLEDIAQTDGLPEHIDPTKDGWGPMVKEYLEYALEQTKGKIPVGITDHQSPYGVATKLLGNEELIFAMFDEPERVHKLLDICADAIIDTAKALQGWLGKENVVLNTSCPVPGEGGIILWDDYVSVLTPAMFQEFCVPANEKVYRAFGRGHLHTCGPYFPGYIDSCLACRPVSLDLNALRGLARPREDMREFRRITRAAGIKLCGGISTCETSAYENKWVRPDYEWLRFMAEGGLLWSESGTVEQGNEYKAWTERLAKENQ